MQVDSSSGSGGNRSMIKSELVARLAERNPHLRLGDVECVVSTVFEQVAAGLARGDRVEIRGFGSFSVRFRGARVGRNPATGDRIDVGEKVFPHFKAGKQLLQRLNNAENIERE